MKKKIYLLTIGLILSVCKESNNTYQIRYEQDGVKYDYSVDYPDGIDYATAERYASFFSDGSACALFQRFNTIQEGMAALKGKTLKVTEMRTVHTLRYDTTSLMYAQLPTIDIVE